MFVPMPRTFERSMTSGFERGFAFGSDEALRRVLEENAGGRRSERDRGAALLFGEREDHLRIG
jgi:hypothetical protein